MISSLTYKTFIVCLICVLAFPCGRAQAQVVVNETQSMTFGTFSFANFVSQLVITINDDGSYTSNGNGVILTPPTRGEFDMDAGIANANSVYTITHTSSFNLTGPGGNFLIDDIRVSPAVLVTDATGFDSFTVAARLTSAGGGTQYANGAYNQNLILTIAF